MSTQKISSKLQKTNIDPILPKEEQLSLLNSGYLEYCYDDDKLVLSPSLESLWEPFFETPPTNSKDIIESILPENKEFIEKVFTLPKANKEIEGEFRLLNQEHNNKDNKHFRIKGKLITHEHKQYLTALIVDVTREVKKYKELNRHKIKAEESDRIKTAFLSNISHNVRTPMNSILGFAELLSISEVDNASKDEFISVIKKESKNLLRLIDDISEFTKYESGILSINKVACNLNSVLKDTFKNLYSKKNEKNKNVTLNLCLPVNGGLEAYTDPGRIQQIFTNILKFSIQNTKSGHIDFGYELPSNEKIDFFVRNTGLPLSKDDQKKLFDKLTINDQQSSYSRYNNNSELSLYISKRIVKAFGGKILVESNEINGSTISFQIPYETVDANTIEISEDETVPNDIYKWNDKVIVIVEDEEVNGLFLEAVINETGAHTIFAQNGIEAIDLCETINKIDLVLMDIRMPVLNGIDATKIIRKKHPDLPIIAQTALCNQEDTKSCLLAGCNDTISKPIDISELLQKISRYL